MPKQNDLQRTVAFFESPGYKNLKVVQEEHYQSLKMGTLYIMTTTLMIWRMDTVGSMLNSSSA